MRPHRNFRLLRWMFRLGVPVLLAALLWVVLWQTKVAMRQQAAYAPRRDAVATASFLFRGVLAFFDDTFTPHRRFADSELMQVRDDFQKLYYWGDSPADVRTAIKTARMLSRRKSVDRDDIRRQLAFLLYLDRDFVRARRLYKQVLFRYFFFRPDFSQFRSSGQSYRVRRALLEMAAISAETRNEKNTVEYYLEYLRASYPEEYYLQLKAQDITAYSAALKVAAALGGDGLFSYRKSNELLQQLLLQRPDDPQIFFEIAQNYLSIVRLARTEKHRDDFGAANAAAQAFQRFLLLSRPESVDSLLTRLREFRQEYQQCRRNSAVFGDMVGWLNGRALTAPVYSLEADIVPLNRSLAQLTERARLLGALLQADVSVLRPVPEAIDRLAAFFPAEPSGDSYRYLFTADDRELTAVVNQDTADAMQGYMADVREFLAQAMESPHNRQIRSALAGMAELSFVRKEYADAGEWYRRALEWNVSEYPQHAEFELQLGLMNALLGQGRYAEVLARARQLYWSNPEPERRRQIAECMVTMYSDTGELPQLRQVRQYIESQQ